MRINKTEKDLDIGLQEIIISSDLFYQKKLLVKNKYYKGMRIKLSPEYG